ncbi:MAG: hypothetical protein K2X82_01990 [Gemmataceae bacterium]|nr:hypothetical protein [Gemmataceae bacterium]
MTDISEVWAAYRAFLADPDVTDDDRRAFWASLEVSFAADALAEARRVVEVFMTDALEPPPEEGNAELLRLWKG